MSFRCNVCDEPQPIGHAPIRIVTKTRAKDAPETSKPCTEIAEEKDCCPPCSERILIAQRNLRIAQEEATAKAIEIQNRNFSNQPKYGERPSEWRDNA